MKTQLHPIYFYLADSASPIASSPPQIMRCIISLSAKTRKKNMVLVILRADGVTIQPKWANSEGWISLQRAQTRTLHLSVDQSLNI